MSLWVKVLLCAVGALFLLFTLVAALQEDWKAMQGGLFVSGLVAFAGFLGWFDNRYPQPPRAVGEKYSLWSELRRFKEAYPGWPGKLAMYGVPALLALLLISQVVALLQSLGIHG